MSLDAWHLPWGPETVPHALLDIIRGCNISCRACYNSLPQSIKSVAEVESELKVLISQRRLSSVSLVGGEPLLHPQLDDIVRLSKSYGLFVEMFSNGLLLEDRRLECLKASGLDIIFVHLDRNQIRPDLPPDVSHDQLWQLRETLTTRIARHGIDVGLVMTAFPGALDEVHDMIEFVVSSPHVNYLLVTLFRDMEQIAEIRGDLLSGLQGTLCDPESSRVDTLTNRQTIEYLRDVLNMQPFAWLGSNRDADDPRWLSYLISVLYGRDGNGVSHSIKASAFEKLYLSLALCLNGRFPMYQKQNSSQFRVQLILNALMGGDFLGNLKVLLHSFRYGTRLRAKRLLFQCPAEVGKDGAVTHCLNCPDAVVKGERLIPACLADKVPNNLLDIATATDQTPQEGEMGTE
ncbi:MAG TPA: radical SAM protein [Candidatus Sumerlaeota bacterium]|nr:radical SAM protein [Candidatus Sumerlaeota bacterium]